MRKNNIYLGDTFNLLDDIADNSVDLLLTDPPYNITMSKRIGKDGKLLYTKPYAHSKHGLDLGNWDEGEFDFNTWLNLLCPKIKDNGQVLIFTSFKNVEIISRVLEENGFTVMDGSYYWFKPNPIPHFPKRLPLSSMEQYVWAVKNPNDFTFNIREGFEYESSRLEYSSHEDKANRFHTTQKPLSMFKHIVKVLSNKGDFVLDTFGGSGTTAVACEELKRKYILFEKDESYHTQSVDRLAKSKKKVKSLWE